MTQANCKRDSRSALMEERKERSSVGGRDETPVCARSASKGSAACGIASDGAQPARDMQPIDRYRFAQREACATGAHSRCPTAFATNTAMPRPNLHGDCH